MPPVPRAAACAAMLLALAPAVLVLSPVTTTPPAHADDSEALSQPEGCVLGYTDPPFTLPLVGRSFDCGSVSTCVPAAAALATRPPSAPGYGPARLPNPLLAVVGFAIAAAGGPSLASDPLAHTEARAALLADTIAALAAGSHPLCGFLPPGVCGAGGQMDQLETFLTPGFLASTLSTWEKVPTAGLADLPLPGEIDGAAGAAFDAATWRVEFSVPKSRFEREILPAIPATTIDALGSIPRVPDPDPSAADLRLRGWFIDVPGDNALVVVLHGNPAFVFGRTNPIDAQVRTWA